MKKIKILENPCPKWGLNPTLANTHKLSNKMTFSSLKMAEIPNKSVFTQNTKIPALRSKNI